MRKIFVFLVVAGITISCGPKRLKCGSGRRCHYVIEKKTKPHNQEEIAHTNT